ncbi:MAG: hypothetical protein ACI4KD_04820 [Oscillospiraceae bacterium]
MGNEDREALYNFSRTRDVDIAVEIGKGVIDTASLVTGILLTGPAGVCRSRYRQPCHRLMR